ncbi:TadE/TadG family type IV pilus assembly protein [Ornithinimicrobium avium]|uniref:Pilus assembly protein n=1 Tax=Ornithinimicrobium avium TaxID=2283195 RepID=A0A345NKU5_9MICO|nr:TadE family protein [Ornithinimicrobium avium]AXH95653.1 pilus assembly protein [Ornithinimicrobium avium]
MTEGRERGAAAVEFAMIAIILLTLVFGIAEFGRLWMIQSTLSAAARDGARTMAVKNDQDPASQAVKDVFSSISPSGPTTLTIAPATGACDSGGQAKVDATYEAPWLTGFFGSGTVTLKGQGVMRCGG